MKNTLKAKKKYGQNFLKSEIIVEKILKDVDLRNHNVLEIGPGNLALTKSIILKNPKKFIAVEIDKEIVSKNKKNHNKVHKFFLNTDALKFDEIDYFNREPFKIISNLPFNISNKLLLKWIKIQQENRCIEEMVLMFQKELAQRIISKENSKKYGRLSILAQAVFKIKKKIIVNKDNFTPRPNVDAMVIQFTPLQKNKIPNINFLKLEEITNFFFNTRRKKIEKKIKKLFNLNQIKENNFEELYNLRPENIPKEIYYKMSKLI